MMKLATIADHREAYQPDVSRSRHTDEWVLRLVGRPVCQRQQANQRLLVEIEAIHERSRGTCGSPRIYAELRARSIVRSRGRVARLMRRNGIVARRHKRYPGHD